MAKENQNSKKIWLFLKTAANFKVNFKVQIRRTGWLHIAQPTRVERQDTHEEFFFLYCSSAKQKSTDLSVWDFPLRL